MGNSIKFNRQKLLFNSARTGSEKQDLTKRNYLLLLNIVTPTTAKVPSGSNTDSSEQEQVEEVFPSSIF